MRVVIDRDPMLVYFLVKKEGSYAKAEGEVSVNIPEDKIKDLELLTRAFMDLQEELEEMYHHGLVS